MRSFQSGAGLPVTGVVDPATWPALVITVRRPDTGAAVRAAQVQLDGGATSWPWTAIFGAGTEAAVRDAQRQNALVIDGVVGPATWRALTGGRWHAAGRARDGAGPSPAPGAWRAAGSPTRCCRCSCSPRPRCWPAPVLTWAVLGGLAGYSLSGSV